MVVTARSGTTRVGMTAAIEEIHVWFLGLAAGSGVQPSALDAVLSMRLH